MPMATEAMAVADVCSYAATDHWSFILSLLWTFSLSFYFSFYSISLSLSQLREHIDKERFCKDGIFALNLMIDEFDWIISWLTRYWAMITLFICGQVDVWRFYVGIEFCYNRWWSCERRWDWTSREQSFALGWTSVRTNHFVVHMRWFYLLMEIHFREEQIMEMHILTLWPTERQREGPWLSKGQMKVIITFCVWNQLFVYWTTYNLRAITNIFSISNWIVAGKLFLLFFRSKNHWKEKKKNLC